MRPQHKGRCRDYQKSSSEFDQLDGVLNQLSPENRKALTDVFASIKPNLDQLMDKALAIPGVGAVIKPAVDAIRSKLAETENPKIEGQVTTPSEAPYAGLLTKLKGIKAGDVDVGALATSAVNDLYTSLVGIKDETTAQGSLSGLSKESSEFDQLDGVLNQLSPENRKALTDVFASIKPNLDQLMDKALAIPGVGAAIKPAVDAIRSKLDTLTKT